MPGLKVGSSPPAVISDEYRDPDRVWGWAFSGACEICCKSKNAAYENGYADLLR